MEELNGDGEKTEIMEKLIYRTHWCRERFSAHTPTYIHGIDAYLYSTNNKPQSSHNTAQQTRLKEQKNKITKFPATTTTMN